MIKMPTTAAQVTSRFEPANGTTDRKRIVFCRQPDVHGICI